MCMIPLYFKGLKHIFFYFSEIIGGPVNDAYRFLQFHMHWGDDVHRGSEHLLDGMAFSAEVQYRHFFTLTNFFAKQSKFYP